MLAELLVDFKEGQNGDGQVFLRVGWYIQWSAKRMHQAKFGNTVNCHEQVSTNSQLIFPKIYI